MFLQYENKLVPFNQHKTFLYLRKSVKIRVIRVPFIKLQAIQYSPLNRIQAGFNSDRMRGRTLRYGGIRIF